MSGSFIICYLSLFFGLYGVARAATTVSNQRIVDLENRLEQLESRLEAKVKEEVDAKCDHIKTALDHQMAKRFIDNPETPHVAFSARLNHDVHHLGEGQTVVFDHTFVNDGNSYSPITGYFTAPYNGVYLFSLFVGEIGNEQILIKLTVNNSSNEVDAIAEGIQAGHNDQGGNMAFLKLTKGQFVSCAAYAGSDSTIDGGTGWYYSTFSGALLYEI